MTVLFADVSGSTTMGELLDPETVTDIMNRGFDRLIGEVKRFGGTIGNVMGDGLLAFFGAPDAHEDDPERAIRAALAMQAAVVPYGDAVRREHGVDYRIRVGINTGPVVAARVGGAGSAEYTVMGDTVNTAARLESNAPIGGIRVGPDTFEATRDRFAFGPVEHLSLKGKAEPFPTYRVLGIAIGATAPTAADAPIPLVGRTDELGRLVAWIDGRTPGRVAAVVGEAGTGKSRLLAAARAAPTESGRRHRWAITRCASYDQDNDYAALGGLLRELLNLTAVARAGSAHADDLVAAVRDRLRERGAPEREVDTAVAVLGDVLGYRRPDHALDRLDPEFRRNVLFRQVRALVDAAARDVPLRLVVEDAQWLDTASALWLRHALTESGDPAWRLLILARPAAAVLETIPAAETVELAPLADDDARELLRRLEARSAATLLPAVATAVLDRAGGNPLFLEELARAVLDAQAGAAGDGETPLPSTLHELVRARLDQLPVAPRRTVGAAAVLGRDFDRPVLAAVAAAGLGLAPADAVLGLTQLDERGLVEPVDAADGSRWSFRQPVTQEVAYESLLLARRRELHTLAGLTIEAASGGRELERLDDLARHFDRGSDDARAARYVRQAADRAAARFQLDHAAQLYRRVLGRLDAVADDTNLPAVERGALRIDVLAALARVEFHRSDYDAAERYCETALAALHGARGQRPAGAAGAAEVCLLQAKTLERRGQYDAAAAALDAADRELDGAAGADAEIRRAEIETWRGWVRLRQGQPAETLAACEAALDRLAAVGASDSAVAALALNNAGAAHQANGDLDAALDAFARSLAVNERLEDPFWSAVALHNLGVIAHTRGDVDGALDRYRAALAIRERIGDRQGAAETASNLGVVEQDLGDLRAAAASFERVLEHFDAVGDAFGAAVARLNLAVVRRQTGDLAVALALGEEALRRFEPLGVPVGPAYTHAHLGATFRALGREADAIDHLERAVAVRREHDLWEDGAEPFLELAVLHADGGRPAEALAALAEAERIAALTDVPPWPVRCQLLRAGLSLAADPQAAADALAALLPDAEAAGGADGPVVVRLLLAQALRALGRAGEATETETEARRVAAERGLALGDPLPAGRV